MPAAKKQTRTVRLRTSLAELNAARVPIGYEPGREIERPAPEAKRLVWRGLADPVDWECEPCPAEETNDALCHKYNLERGRRTPTTAAILDEQARKRAAEEANIPGVEG